MILGSKCSSIADDYLTLCNQDRDAVNKHKVLPVPVGLSNNAFLPVLHASITLFIYSFY
jgi:hypothetical protein